MDKIKQAQSILMKARSEIVRIGKLMFFGTIIYDVNIIASYKVGAQAIDTMATDGNNIWANPDYILDITHGENKGVLVHEVLHISNCHHLRMGDREHELWNVSCDYAINPHVLDAGMLLPKGALIEERFKGKSAEQIYNILKKERDAASKQQQQQDQQDRALNNSGAPQSPQDAPDGSSGNAAGNGAGGSGGGSSTRKSGAGLLLKPTENPREQEARIKTKVIQAARLCEIGNVVLPEGVDKLVQDAKKPLVDWRERLRQFVTSSCETPVDRTWSKPNRRALAMGAYLPGWRKEDAGHLVIVKDTSGSIDDAPNAQFDAEIKMIVEDVRPQRVTVIACDNRVRSFQSFNSGEEIVLSSAGGGGTAFSPAINRINGLNEKVDAVVYFTDLKCYDYGVPDGYPVMWVQWDNWPVVPPYGEVVKIKE